MNTVMKTVIVNGDHLHLQPLSKQNKPVSKRRVHGILMGQIPKLARL
jgi:hypothetical protein